ncbi:MAG TPA: POTRA domain-containing protein [Puia sp.]|nr:POTRA domain-containing protein [Puia sp.]
MLRSLLTGVFLLTICLLKMTVAEAQVTDTTHHVPADTTHPVSVDPELLAIENAKTPKEYVIAGIKITGTKYLDESLLISVSGLSIGDKVMIPGGDNFSKAIQKLWNQNLFSNIGIYFTKITGNELSVEINVTERPRLTNFIFEGASKSESDELKIKTGLIKGRVITENMKQTADENIKKYYADKGFQGVEVKITEQRDPKTPNSESLTFVIDKGTKVRINQINIYGTKAISSSRLKKQMDDTKEVTKLTLFPAKDSSSYGVVNPMTFKEYIDQQGFLSYTKTKEVLDPYFRFKLFSSAKFNEKKYREDEQRIISYYNSQGYRDAVIVSDTLFYNSKKQLNIAIKVDEGVKYYFGNITWKGNTKYPDTVLSLVLGIRKGDVYNLDILNKKLGKEVSQEGGGVSDLYLDDGYLFFRIDPVETAVYNDTIDFEIRMVEGPQATIKNVTIAGNEKTKEYVIRRELRTIPGEKFSRQDIIRSTREIVNLGYFNQEKVVPNIVPNQEDGTVDINWSVEEKSSDQLELSAGWGGGIGVTGTVGITFNNFSINNIWKKSAWDPLPTGDGQKLSLRVQANGKAYQSYNLSFTEPWLGGKKRNSLTVSLYRSAFRTGGYNYTTSKYAYSDTNSLKNFGVVIALGKQLKWPDDYFTLTYSLNYTLYDLTNYSLFSPDFRNGYSNNLSFKVGLGRYSVDQPIYPRSGSNFMISAQFTPPYSLFKSNYNTSQDQFTLPEYTKFRLTSQWYIPIGKPMGADKSRQFVLYAGVKLGFMGRYNSESNFSPFERFQLGDAGLTNNFGLLGYEIISQRGYPVYQNSDPRINPEQTGATQFFTMFNKYTLEMRYPFVTSPSSTIYGEAFFEAANGWYDYQSYNPFRLRRDVGIGLRFFLPMFGLLGFDYGIGLDRIQNGQLSGASRFTFMLGVEPE